MTTKDSIKAEIDNIDEADLDELYEVVKQFLQAKAQITNKTERGETRASGLCGIWQDDRTAEAIIEEIVTARSQGRDVRL